LGIVNPWLPAFAQIIPLVVWDFEIFYDGLYVGVCLWVFGGFFEGLPSGQCVLIVACVFGVVRVECIHMLCRFLVLSDAFAEFLGCVCAGLKAWWFCIPQIQTFAACDWSINNLLYSLL
jgi:hypothetical protein